MHCKLCYTDLSSDHESDFELCDTCAMRIARRYHKRVAIELREQDEARSRRTAEKAQARAERQAITQPPGPRQDYQTEPVVYYVRIGDHVKIGYSANLRQRIKTLRVDADNVLAIEPGGLAVETHRHRQFKQARVGRREDFNPGPELLAHIATLRDKHGIPGWLTPPPPHDTRHATPVVVRMRDNP